MGKSSALRVMLAGCVSSGSPARAHVLEFVVHTPGQEQPLLTFDCRGQGTVSADTLSLPLLILLVVPFFSRLQQRCSAARPLCCP